MIFTGDERKKEKLKRMTVFEYKMTLAYAVLAVCVLVAGLFFSYVFGKFTRDVDYYDRYILSEYNSFAEFDLWFSFTNPSFITFAACMVAVVYLLYELKRWHLCDDTNLSAGDARLLLVKDTLIYISSSEKVHTGMKEIVYLPLKDITHVVYDKRFERMEFYGIFYKDTIHKENTINEPVLLGSLLLYNYYSPDLAEVLMRKGIMVRENGSFLKDAWGKQGERIIEPEVRDEVRAAIRGCFEKEDGFSLAEYLDKLFTEGRRPALIQGVSNRIDRMNYKKYHIILAALTAVAAVNIALLCMYGRLYERIMIAAVCILTVLRGYNGYEVNIIKKGKHVAIEEISHIYVKEIKHVFEFRTEGIKRIHYSLLKGMDITVDGTYTCYYNLEETDKMELEEYHIRFHVGPGVCNKFKEAVHFNKTYRCAIREAGIKRPFACYDWRGFR